ncbi:PREDICTED: uncharacterized protein LOC106814847 [Priapulus caudatus]|uniref:Uncharacterized protein LOC106814847 n=1 Tax=Priapulus caudatus TaxID=37621 RepID=A0ABM1ER76_PRICU|nr:PREDICTED: uncharacterized protein LOC106814847 [Priapulus caudatus]
MARLNQMGASIDVSGRMAGTWLGCQFRESVEMAADQVRLKPHVAVTSAQTARPSTTRYAGAAYGARNTLDSAFLQCRTQQLCTTCLIEELDPHCSVECGAADGKQYLRRNAGVPWKIWLGDGVFIAVDLFVQNAVNVPRLLSAGESIVREVKAYSEFYFQVCSFYCPRKYSSRNAMVGSLEMAFDATNEFLIFCAAASVFERVIEVVRCDDVRGHVFRHFPSRLLYSARTDFNNFDDYFAFYFQSYPRLFVEVTEDGYRQWVEKEPSPPPSPSSPASASSLPSTPSACVNPGPSRDPAPFTLSPPRCRSRSPLRSPPSHTAPPSHDASVARAPYPRRVVRRPIRYGTAEYDVWLYEHLQELTATETAREGRVERTRRRRRMEAARVAAAAPAGLPVEVVVAPPAAAVADADVPVRRRRRRGSGWTCHKAERNHHASQ